jgi:hypothetical protein
MWTKWRRMSNSRQSQYRNMQSFVGTKGRDALLAASANYSAVFGATVAEWLFCGVWHYGFAVR